MENWTPEILQAKLEKGEKVFLKLWKKGCGACKLANPAIERMEKDNGHQLSFGQILIDDHPEMLEHSETEVLPAFFVFRDKEMKGKFIGFKGLAKLQEFVEESMA